MVDKPTASDSDQAHMSDIALASCRPAVFIMCLNGIHSIVPENECRVRTKVELRPVSSIRPKSKGTKKVH